MTPTPDITRLRSLLERCEKAEGPSMEMDGRLAVLFGVVSEKRRPGGYYAFFAEPRRPGDSSFLGGYWDEEGRAYKSLGQCITCPQYTASLDAAVALIEKALPGWVYTADSSLNEVQLFSPAWPDGPSSDGHGATMTLAYLSALLKALIVREEQRAGEEKEVVG